MNLTFPIMTKKKPYFPNNWEAFRNAPDDAFKDPTGDLTFEEFMDWKIGGYELPSSVACIIREEDVNTGRIKEHVYQREYAAKKKATQIMKLGKSNLTICTPEGVQHVYLDEYHDTLT